jgi:hypothetical protein
MYDLATQERNLAAQRARRVTVVFTMDSGEQLYFSPIPPRHCGGVETHAGAPIAWTDDPARAHTFASVLTAAAAFGDRCRRARVTFWESRLAYASILPPREG